VTLVYAVAILVVFVTPASAQQPLRCAAPGYTATYSPPKTGVVPMVDVTFRAKPSSAVAEATLRKCVKEAADTMFITAELMGNVWFGDDLVTLLDGSDHLVYNPKTKQILTWNEREGTKVVPVSQGAGFFAEYQDQKISVPPYGTFGTLDIVFAKQPTEKVAYETAIAELTKAVQRTGGSKDVMAYVYVGPRENRAGRQTVKGANGRFISVKFTAKTRKVTNGNGEILSVQVTGLK
jgi:hypothetical protein